VNRSLICASNAVQVTQEWVISTISTTRKLPCEWVIPIPVQAAREYFFLLIFTKVDRVHFTHCKYAFGLCC